MAFLPFLAAGMEAGGSLLKGFGSAEQAHYQSQIARNNEIVAQQNAAHAAGATSAQVLESGLRARAQNAGVRASLASLGVDVNSGSAGQTQISQREISRLDTENVANRGAQAVYGYEAQAQNFKAESQMYGAEEGFDIAGGVVGAAGDIAGAVPDLPGGGGTVSPVSSVASGYNVSPIDTSVDSNFVPSASLIEGAPSVGTDYAWMLQNGGGAFG